MTNFIRPDRDRSRRARRCAGLFAGVAGGEVIEDCCIEAAFTGNGAMQGGFDKFCGEY